MVGFAEIAAFILLVIIVLQDFRARAISWVLLPLLFIVFAWKGITVLGSRDFFYNTLVNISFIALQLLLLTLYVSLKNKRWVNIIDTHLGLGDILFFLAISSSFAPLHYIAFYILGSLLTLIGFVVYRSISRKPDLEIPLAGGMAAVMILLLMTNQFIPELSFYNDHSLIAIIYK